ncbi:MAG: fibronectin type III domain-containing protein [Vicinamibacterales bacterium]
MFRRLAISGLIVPSLALAAACSQSPQSPVSPSVAAGSAEANADGSLLKVTAPTLVSPEDGAVTEGIRPTVIFRNASGRFASVALGYRVQVFNAAGNVIAELQVAQDPSGQTSLGAEADLANDTEYRWRVRAEYQGEAGPWSATWSFKTPPRVSLGAVGGPVGPPRNIGIVEAVDIIFAIYQGGRFNIGRGSNRTQLNLYLEMAVAAIHYGHGKWNPRGPDSNWCIKNGGPGRPQSDDVIVLCSSRDAWDLVGGIGGPNPVWSTSYIGRLDNAQQVYAPNPATLALLP